MQGRTRFAVSDVATALCGRPLVRAVAFQAREGQVRSQRHWQKAENVRLVPLGSHCVSAPWGRRPFHHKGHTLGRRSPAVEGL